MTTLVTFLLDRSGSMGSIRNDTIGAFNIYLDELKKGDDISFSFLQFDSVSLDTVCKNLPIGEVPALTTAGFEPRGSTPLIDACVKTIHAVEKALQGRDDKPKVVICFQTDGEENCSREHTWAELNDLIKAKSAEGWQFNFMGASIDAYQQAQHMGLSAAQTMSYDSRDQMATRASFAASAQNTVMFGAGLSASTGYSSAQKRAAKDRFDPANRRRAPAPDLSTALQTAGVDLSTPPLKVAKKAIVDEPQL